MEKELENKEIETVVEEKDTILVVGFPGVGKSYFTKNHPELVVMDSDSSNFSWVKDADGNNTKERNPDFPNNYINHIKENIGKADVVLISSHKVVRDALKINLIKHVVVVPSVWNKQEYLKRYKERGSSESFVGLMDKNWNEWVMETMEQNPFNSIVILQANETLNSSFDKVKEVHRCLHLYDGFEDIFNL